MPPERNQRPRKDKQEPISGGAMADCVFPEDIMLCILRRLPVKSILRFKSVCKPWLVLFQTSEFVKMHQGQFSSDPKNQSLILRPYPGSHKMNIVGCCNGLVCVITKGNEKKILLWNPALKLCKFVRALKVYGMVSLGFGYDADGDDFKVVRIVCGVDKGIEMAEVYSADSDSWTTIELGFQFKVFDQFSDLTVNGNPYWIASVKKKDKVEVLVCFDVRKMVFMIVPLPAFIDGSVELVDWKGSLGALLCEKDESGMFTSLGVWVLDDGEGVWRKIHTLGPIQGSVGRFTVCLKNGKLVGKGPEESRYTERGRWNHLKFSDTFRNGKLIVLDPDNDGCVEEILIEESQKRPFKIYGYTESLTHIKGMVKEVDEREWDMKKKVCGDLATYQWGFNSAGVRKFISLSGN